jgi:hypothetical protein
MYLRNGREDAIKRDIALKKQQDAAIEALIKKKDKKK